ncbi:unnamed protein product [Ceratitis capitata]|uniref:(Mediterranean fruit fly) hypothetical protein n=1 Tax=Ceratitis capitata TaxID=7213 RepID=A0A811UYG7_CERCA|nr:unnamed protein product [Ceratitis capitata]
MNACCINSSGKRSACECRTGKCEANLFLCLFYCLAFIVVRVQHIALHIGFGSVLVTIVAIYTRWPSVGKSVDNNNASNHSFCNATTTKWPSTL